MNLDELQSVQARERQSSDLQHLRQSFYVEVGEYIRDLQAERAQAVERADDPFSSSEVRQLSNDIETAEQTIEAIYERRVGKVVKKASIAAAGMPVEDDGLTTEEGLLFDDLVGRIQDNREAVLSVLEGDAPSVSCSIDDETASSQVDGTESDDNTASPADESPPTTGDSIVSTSHPSPAAEDSFPNVSEADAVSAADLMGRGGATESEGDTPTSERDAPTDSAPTTATETGETAPPPSISLDDGGEPSPPGNDTHEPTSRRSSDSVTSDEATIDSARRQDGDVPTESGRKQSRSGVPRATVRITADVGEIVGVDDRDYHLGSEDVVALPEPNATVLIEKNAAERLE